MWIPETQPTHPSTSRSHRRINTLHIDARSPCFMVPPLPRFVCMHAPSPSSTPHHTPDPKLSLKHPPRSFIHHFIGIHSTVHSSRDKHHADPCCPHTNPRRSALSTSTSTSTKRPCQPQPARTSNEQNKNGVPAHMRGNAVHLTEKSTRVGLLLIHQHHMGGFQPRPDRCLDNARTHTLELGDHLGGLVDLSLRGTPLQRHQTTLRLQ